MPTTSGRSVHHGTDPRLSALGSRSSATAVPSAESRGPRAEIAVPSPAPAARGLAGALLGYLVAVMLVVTLAPFEFRMPDTPRVWLTEWTPFDIVANVLLFAPFGFVCAQLGRDGEADLVTLLPPVAAFAALTSTTIELAQLFVPERYTSPWDVLANVAGATLGALAFDWCRRRLDPSRVVGQLGLELPLMGLVYLLVPLGWLDALLLAAHPERWPLTLCLGLFGGSVLGAVQRRHFGPSGVLSAPGMGALAAGGWVLCSLPALSTRPVIVATTALGVGALTWYRAAEPAPEPGPAVERRFELMTLLRAAPYFAAYLLLLGLVEPAAGAALRRPVIVQLVETMGAFTLLGYMAAEAFSRFELPYHRAVPRVLAVAIPIALALGVARDAGPLTPAAWLGVAVTLVAATYGGWLFHLQRGRVRGMAKARAA